MEEPTMSDSPDTKPDVADEGTPDAGAPGAGELPPSADQVKVALRKVKDPELNLNIVDLGLIYEIAVEGSEVQVDMTLTSPGCPAGPQIMGDVERVLKALPGVTDVAINLVWQPFWSPDKIEPRVRAYMGL
jgi:metal-sulfur cluster biosynthetic enzyme